MQLRCQQRFVHCWRWFATQEIQIPQIGAPARALRALRFPSRAYQTHGWELPTLLSWRWPTPPRAQWFGRASPQSSLPHGDHIRALHARIRVALINWPVTSNIWPLGWRWGSIIFQIIFGHQKIWAMGGPWRQRGHPGPQAIGVRHL